MIPYFLGFETLRFS